MTACVYTISCSFEKGSDSDSSHCVFCIVLLLEVGVLLLLFMCLDASQ